ncbi:hypothetical protein J5N97_028959 [Dioscorea zingiberensis]|uniref:Uncharacterized protein n=1 Tax=Dioscorea zingiberensis TaxID=325984 RepID=A0A9D5C0J7_9LILI|nr:hypothetical protein J5N97_028959 [Dioscorea zingiberensis]
MDRAGENYRGLTRSSNSRGLPMDGVKLAGSEMGTSNNRRALRDIKNFVRAPPYPCGMNKSKVPLVDKSLQHGAVARRPITRRFAASLATKSQACQQDTNTKLHPIGNERRKQSIPSVPNLNVLDTSNAIDVDDFRSVDDLPLPMVDEMEELANCELKEVEMEDLEEVEPIPDIDSYDSKNPFAVVEYVEDIYNFYRHTEDVSCVCPNYMSDQFDINERMRAILIDWLIEVHYKFDLMDETLYLTVNIIDRFLARQTVVRKKLQLVGVTAMLLACKYEEISVPVVDDLILISDRAYTRSEVLEMLELLSFFIIELSLVEYQMLKFRPSLLAAAAIYTAQCTLKGFRHWTRTSELHTSYSEEQLLECSRMMVDFHQKAGHGKLTGVHRKYSTSKFGCAAKSEPALFLLEKRH